MSSENSPLISDGMTDFLQSLHLLTLELAAIGTMKELYREAVRRGRELLDIDRMAILLYDPDKNTMQGTFGTDKEGNLVDESDFLKPVNPDNRFLKECLEAKHQVATWEDMDLIHRTLPVGRGWSGMGALWDGDRPFGWLAVDNLLRHLPQKRLQKDLLGLYCAILGGLILRKRHEQDLVRKVAETTTELRIRMVELDRLASLGSMVAAVYHDVNTPLGNAVLAGSHIGAEVLGLQEALAHRTLGQNQLQDGLEKIGSSAKVVDHNLDRARKLIESFKRLAVNQSSGDRLEVVGLREIVEEVAVSFSPLLRKAHVEVALEIDPELTFDTFPGVFDQILSNLVANSLAHGFEGWTGEPRKVTIRGGRPGGPEMAPLVMEYQDNGRGIAPTVRDKIFQPFVTTKKGQGGSGLGMSIVHSLVTDRLGGTIEVFDPEAGGAGFRIALPPKPPVS